jgi:hypothetical protein
LQAIYPKSRVALPQKGAKGAKHGWFHRIFPDRVFTQWVKQNHAAKPVLSLLFCASCAFCGCSICGIKVQKNFSG